MDLHDFGTKVVDLQKLNTLRKVMYQLVLHESYYRQQEQNGQLDLTKFLGAHPVVLCKRDFSFMRRTKYWITEKSDGQRCMFLALNEGIYIVNSTFEFYLINANKMMLPTRVDANRPQHKTVLDGELVFNHHFKKYCYMVFDIICVNGQRIAETNLENRLKAIRDEIIVPLRQLYSENDERLPFLILGKEFFPIDKLDWLLQHIQFYKDEEGDRFVYEHGKRYNENDGIIFTPDKYEYKPGMSTVTKKWKWPQLNTLIFQVRLSNQDRRINKSGNSRKQFKLFLWNTNQHIEYRQAYFSPSCQQKLIMAMGDRSEALVECSYSVTGEWKFIRIRPDKSHASNITDALQTLESVADNIDSDTLKQNLLRITRVSTTTTTHVRNHSSTTEQSLGTPMISNEGTPGTSDGSDASPDDIIYDSPEIPELDQGIKRVREDDTDEGTIKKRMKT